MHPKVRARGPKMPDPAQFCGNWHPGLGLFFFQIFWPLPSCGPSLGLLSIVKTAIYEGRRYVIFPKPETRERRLGQPDPVSIQAHKFLRPHTGPSFIGFPRWHFAENFPKFIRADLRRLNKKISKFTQTCHEKSW
jgi:hypothetical protein